MGLQQRRRLAGCLGRVHEGFPVAALHARVTRALRRPARAGGAEKSRIARAVPDSRALPVTEPMDGSHA